MRVLVIGSTGATGKIVVRKLLAAGHEVTAFARNPAAIAETSERLRVVQGDARDAASIVHAVRGQDAVVSVFGPRSFKAGDVQEVLMRNLVAAMEQEGVTRLVNLSAAGAGDSRAESPFLFRAILMPLLLRSVFADKERGEKILSASNLEFTNVRPGRLVDKAARGGVKAQLGGSGLRFEMTREDLADFMIAQLTRREWIRASPLVGY
jgi:uncharacterized protein YbjT (DUF2867 family)